MKFTLDWLKQHLDTNASLTEICDKLTAIGLEVENVHDRGKALAPFIVAEVLTAEKHPDADRLKVTTVNTGKETIQVVCGAPNCRAGLKTVLARPGDVMPNSGEALKKGTIRGVESQGMLCAADELGLGEEHTGIIELPADAPVGESFAKYAKLDDPVIEINLTPNRPDCAGVRGIARDLAAAGLGTLKTIDIPAHKGTEPSRIKVKLENVDKACPVFASRLIRNIKNGPSPHVIQQRLQAIGLRPISALVDITNYLTFSSCRPLHVFDAKKVKGNIWVRPAKGGEKFKALNGKEYVLEAGMTVIGDDSGVISLGGIMGGESTSVDENTTEVFIESAYFDPVRTTRTGRALQISSDARYRFERGIDPEFTVRGVELATKLVLEFCGTSETVISELEVTGHVPETKQTLTLDTGKTLRHTGVDVGADEQVRILNALGFEAKLSGTTITAVVPSWRPDIDGPNDLVEEIVRIKGFDHIPATSLDRPNAVTSSAIDLQDQRGNSARRALAAQGLQEAVTWSFMPSKIAEQFGAINDKLRLANPISSDLDVMRPNILGNLIEAAKRNADRGFADVGLFEVGPVFKDPTPEGQETVATMLRAGSTPRHWAIKQRPVDAFDAKADALATLTAWGVPTTSLQITTDAPAWYHPGRSGALRLGPTVLAYFGEIHPALIAACDAEGPMVGAEIFFSNIPQSRSGGTAKPLLKLESLQAIARDFAFVVDSSVTAAKLIKAIKDADKNLIRDVNVFDIYEGERLGPNKKSVALSVTLQASDKTLTDVEIENLSSKITASVTKATGAVLRG